MKVLSVNVYDGNFGPRGVPLDVVLRLAEPYSTVCIQDCWDQEPFLATARSRGWITAAMPSSGLAILSRRPFSSSTRYYYKTRRWLTAKRSPGVLGIIVDGACIYTTATTVPLMPICGGNEDVEAIQMAELWTHVDATSIGSLPVLVTGDIHCSVENPLVPQSESFPGTAIGANMGKHPRATLVTSPMVTTERVPIEIDVNVGHN